MLRAMWTAASGMKSQQMYIDSIANNLANVNTVGFKKESMEFKSLFYETLRSSSVDEEGNGIPVSLQIGHGVRASANVKNFSAGNLDTTNNPLDFAITGDGFFVVQDLNGNNLYTKNGSFKLAVMQDGLRLVTSDGYSVLSSDGEPIEFEDGFLPSTLAVDSLGNMSIIRDDTVEDLGIRFELAQFRNPAGLDAVGGSYYKMTAASGEPLLESEDELVLSTINQGTLEGSNVQVVEEMVKMIIAQRAYELNSKAIQTSDDMLGVANSLKR